MQADHQAVSRLLKTARGQIDGVLRMIEEDRYCIDVSTQLMAVESVLRRANREVLRGHMEGCLRQAAAEGDETRLEEKIAEIVSVLEKLQR